MIQGEATPRVLPVVDGLTLGRGPSNDMDLTCSRVARLHACLRLRDGRLFVEDLGSPSGTSVNDAQVDESEVAPGDVLRLGEVHLAVEVVDEDAASAGERDEGDGGAAADSAPRPGPAGSRMTGILIRRAGKRGVPIPEHDEELRAEVRANLEGARAGAPRFARLAEYLTGLGGAHGAQVLVRVAAAGPYLCAAVHPEGRCDRAGSVGRSVLAEAEFTGHGVIGDAQGLDGGRSTAGMGARSVICAPLAIDGEVLGAVYLERRAGRDAFSEGERLDVARAAIHATPLVADDLRAFLFEQEEHLDLCGCNAGRPVVVGRSAAFQSILQLVESMASSQIQVLFTGESGTGRRTLARELHALGEAASHPFRMVQCSRAGQGDDAARLFGRTQGGRAVPGVLDEVGRGTLCLTDVAKLSRAAQVRIDHALVQGRYWPSGGQDTTRAVRCRIVATTTLPLDRLVDNGRLIPELRDRLAACTIRVPPLSERTGDVPVLARHFASVHGIRHLGRPCTVHPEALGALLSYPFPGNVAELSNQIERAVLLCREDVVRYGDLSADVQAAASNDAPTGYSLADAERAAFLRALQKVNWKKGAAAELLGISWPTMTKKYRSFKMDRLRP